MLDNNLTSGPVCLISSQKAVEDVVPEVPEVHHVCGELHLFCTYPFSDCNIMIYNGFSHLQLFISGHSKSQVNTFLGLAYIFRFKMFRLFRGN